tara:strand:- start:934 stop:1167 length:234 start_codon:yes stop_codon:yes gene_type:complete
MEIQLAFEAEVSVHQRINVVNKQYNEERVVRELQEGVLVTTTWHDQNGEPPRLETASGVLVGYIVSQEMEGDYFNFR